MRSNYSVWFSWYILYHSFAYLFKSWKSVHFLREVQIWIKESHHASQWTSFEDRSAIYPEETGILIETLDSEGEGHVFLICWVSTRGWLLAAGERGVVGLCVLKSGEVFDKVPREQLMWKLVHIWRLEGRNKGGTTVINASYVPDLRVVEWLSYVSQFADDMRTKICDDLTGLQMEPSVRN